LPGFQTKASSGPEMAKKDFNTLRVRKPLGRAAEWFDIKLITKWCAMGGTSPANGAWKKYGLFCTE
jgi:hypothetical protein